MIRAAAEILLVFLVPFAAFAVTLLLLRRNVLHIQSWSGPAVWLAGAGLVLVLASFVYEGAIAPRPLSGFEPTHMENGRVVPGRFR